MLAVQSLVGLILFPLLAWLASEDRRALGRLGAARWIAACLMVQIATAVLLTQLPWTGAVFTALGQAVAALQAAVDAGA